MKMIAPTQEERVRQIPRASLAWIFLKIGAAAFGETGSVVALTEREFVEQRGLLAREEIAEALAYTKLLPGSTVVQIVAYLGYLLGGWATSALVTAMFVLPSALAMVVLAAGYVAVTALPHVQPAITGLTAAVIGMLLATGYRIGMKSLTSFVALGLADATFVLGGFLSINAALIVVAAGLIGMAFARAKRSAA